MVVNNPLIRPHLLGRGGSQGGYPVTRINSHKSWQLLTPHSLLQLGNAPRPTQRIRVLSGLEDSQLLFAWEKHGGSGASTRRFFSEIPGGCSVVLFGSNCISNKSSVRMNMLGNRLLTRHNRWVKHII